MTRLLPVSLIGTMLLTGCAASSFMSQAKREFAEASRLEKEANAEMDRECRAQPESCKTLVDFDSKKGPDDPSAWSTKQRPGYHVWFERAFWGPLKAVTIKWTGLESQ
jgi:hypothetical protein